MVQARTAHRTRTLLKIEFEQIALIIDVDHRFVRDQGGYGKTDFPFAEFQWGNFFRNFINITQISPSAHDEQQPQQSSNGTSPDSWSWCQVLPRHVVSCYVILFSFMSNMFAIFFQVHPFAVECVSNLEDRVHNGTQQKKYN